VLVFDHTLRTADDADRMARKIREVVQRVHNDYTEWSGPQRVRDLLPQEAEALWFSFCAAAESIWAIDAPCSAFIFSILAANSVCSWPVLAPINAAAIEAGSMAMPSRSP
jgi:hypothetical protein